MSDPYGALVRSSIGRRIAKTLGLPRPVRLRRFDPDDSLCDSPVVVTGPGPYAAEIAAALEAHHHLVVVADPAGEDRIGGLVLDLSSLRDPAELDLLRALGAEPVKRLTPNARVIVIGTDPAGLTDPKAVATQTGLAGATRSLAKELRNGATANLIQAPVQPNPSAVAATAVFFLSGRSAYVDGQPLVLNNASAHEQDADQPLAGRVAVVTGAARGIGAAIATSLARDGASVVGVDLPTAGEALAAVVNSVGGTALPLDVSTPEAGDRIVRHCLERHDGLDIVVHNAGITRDKLLINLDAERWSQVIDVNLRSMLAMNQALLGPDGLREGGRMVCLSSMNGIAGSRGQTNYAASKAGVMGMVRATARLVADRGITVNAVAPGFIETEMTARMPLGLRELGRRMNSLQQGGLPVDVAETIAFLASPAAQAITGQALRVCGQNVVGA